MNTKRNIKAMLILFCALFVILCLYLLYILGAYGARWIASPYNTHISKRKSMVEAGDIRDRNGELLAYTDADGERHYADSRALRRALCHIVGDSHGQTIGAEATFSKYTLGFDHSLLETLRMYAQGKTMDGSDVKLTVDAELALYCYDLMDDYWGAVVVMDYETGEILASVSQPTFDPEKMEDYLSGEESLAGSAMVNRASMGRYTPGSTFKIVTLVAALRHLDNAQALRFSCEGPLAFDAEDGGWMPDVNLSAERTNTENAGRNYDREAEYAEDSGAEPALEADYNVVRDYQGEYHGEIGLKEAFAASCNTSFAQLSLLVGDTRMERTARELGIGEEFQFADFPIYKSAYEAGDTDLSLAWSAIGQYKDLMTPMQMCMLAAAIANDGVMMEPKLLKSVTTPSGMESESLRSRPYKTVLSAAEAAVLQEYMEYAVEEGTGRRAASEDYRVCGKTGTAEISSDKSVDTHAWFVGFVRDREHPIAICVVLEQAGGGGSVAAPMAGKILEKAVRLGY